MHKLTSLSPLGFKTPKHHTIGSFTISEVTDRAMVSVTARRGSHEAVKKILSKILNKAVPDIGCHVAGKFDAFWIGQGQWMLCAPFNTHEDIVAIFHSKFKGEASLTEQTDGWCRFAIDGPDLAQLCSLLCNVDTRSFKSGRAVRTTIEHIGCFILRLENTKMQVIGPRSSAESLSHALSVAAQSVVY